MRCVTVHTAVLALLGALFAAQQLATAQYLNNRPYPTYSLEQMPDTRFTCRDKVLGGYYADSETQCQMFHICVKVAGLGVQDFRFLCPNGTAFDQDSQICADWDDVDCEAATLYYSSDNFDLYRVGSGYETAAFAGEDEGTFHLQRSETGDARLIREHQSQRVNQQTDYNTVVPPRRPSPPQQRGERDRDILRASQSGNFFNNRNGGKEEDDYYNEDRHPNQNQDVPKKKVVRKFNQRKPVEDNYEQPQAQAQPQAQTQRPQRPTGFVNNFAGSIRPISTTLKPTTVNNNDQYQEPRRQNPRNRGGDRQYNNAENFRNNDYNRNQQASTPAPFRAPENNNKQYKNTNRQTTQYNNQYDNGQYNPTTAAPKSTFNNNQYDNQRTTQAVRQNFNNNNQQYQAKQQTENYPSTPAVNNKQTFQNKQTENYPSTPAVNNKQTFQNKQTENYPSTPAVNNKQTFQNKQTENYPTTPVKQQNFNNYQTKQTENYPTTPIKQQTFNNNFQTKQTENYPSTPAVQNYNSYKQTDNYPSTVAKPKQTDNYPSTVAKPKQTENYPSTVSPFKQQTTQFKKETENYPTTAGFTNNQNYNKQYDIPKKTTQFKQTENYPTTLAPSKQTYQKPTTQYYQPKETENYPQNNNKQSTQQYNTQYDNSRTQHSPTNRPTTQHTQYTPTVPKQTAQFYASTTPSARFSKQFDETSYDDGSYNGKYDEDKYKPEEEFLKTAHSQNFASARNELLSSTKTGSSVTTQSPRPFSLTTPIPRASSPARQTQSLPKQTQAIPKQTQAIPKQTQAIPKQTQAIQKQTQAVPKQSHRPEQQQQPKKKEKDVSYDYAYYDSNVGSEPDYDIGTEFAKSTKKTN